MYVYFQKLKHYVDISKGVQNEVHHIFQEETHLVFTRPY